MTKLTHILAGVVGGIAFSAFIPAAMFGSTLPDVDVSWAFKRDLKTKKSVHRELPAVLQHRGFTHHLLLWCGMLAAPYCMADSPTKELLFGVAVGGMSHILSDMLNPSGVPYWRTKDRFAAGLLATNSFGEAIFAAFLVVIGAIVLPENLIDIQSALIGL